MRTLLGWLVFVAVVVAVGLTVGTVAGAQSHSTAVSLAPLAVPFLIGYTAGTGTGSDFSGLNDMLKQVYTGPFQNNVEKDSELADMFQLAEDGSFELIDGPDGKQVNLGHIFSSGGGVGAMNHDDYLYTPTNPTTKQSSATIKQLVAIVELSGQAIRRVKQGPAAFINWADQALPAKAQRLAFQRDRMLIGAGNGIIGRINMATPASTDLAIDSAFGITGLDNAAVCSLLLRDDSLRVGPNANGTSLRTGTALVVSVDYPNSEININALPASAADNDYIFLGDGNVQGSGTREFQGGLEAAIDNGTNVATFQGLARTTYPEMNGQIVDSTTGGFGGTLTEDLLDYSDSLCYERGNMGKPKYIVCSRSGQRSFWKSLKGDRVINDPRGLFQGGKARLQMMLGDRIVQVRAARKVPVSRCYGIDPTSVLRLRNGAGRWDDTDGAVFNRVVDGTGRKDAFFAVYVQEEEIAWSDPAKNFKITGLTAA